MTKHDTIQNLIGHVAALEFHLKNLYIDRFSQHDDELRLRDLKGVQRLVATVWLLVKPQCG